MKRVSAAREYREQNLLRANIETGFERSLEYKFRQYVRLCAKEYRENESLTRAENILEEHIRKVFYTYYETTIRTFAERMNARLGRLSKKEDEDPYKLLVGQFLALFGAEKVVQVSLNLKILISDTVQKGLEANMTIPQIATEIEKLNKLPKPTKPTDAEPLQPLPRDIPKKPRKDGKSPIRVRSERISRTEVHNAASFANHQMAVQSGIKGLRRMWLSASGERTRPSHSAANGQVRGMEEPFNIGEGEGYALMYPGDPTGPAKEVVNCRCVVSVFRPEEV